MNMLSSPLKKIFDKVITGVFDERKETKISLKGSQKSMLGHEYSYVKRCFGKKANCKNHRCVCKVNNSICGSGCACRGTCNHTKKLMLAARNLIALSPCLEDVRKWI